MKSIAGTEINVQQQEVAGLFADPGNNPKWMPELDRCGPVSGTQEMPGSTCRLVTKEGDMIFPATIVERNLRPTLRLHPETAGLGGAVPGKLIARSPSKTKLIPEVVFAFKGGGNVTGGPAVEEAIRLMHRRHNGDVSLKADCLEALTL